MKKLLPAIATLTGTTIGAGILGIPYAFAKAGFLIALLQLVFVGLIILFINLCLGEVTLRTKGIHQLPGYAEKYLGKSGKILLLVSCFIFIYGALVAYTIGEGEVLSFVFFGNTRFQILFGVAFFCLMCVLVYFGIKAMEKGELFGLIFTTATIFAIFLFFLPKINLENFLLVSKEKSLWFFPYGIIMFAFLGFSAIPEMREELWKQEKLLKKAIMIGTLIPLVFYLLFGVAVYGFAGKNTPEIATIALGKLPCILAIFTMFSAFFALAIALKEIFIYDLKMKHGVAFFLVVFPVFLVAFSIMMFKLTTFIRVLNFVGSVAGGLGGILILEMIKRAKNCSERKPEYTIKISFPVYLLLILLFVFGIIYSIIFNLL